MQEMTIYEYPNVKVYVSDFMRRHTEQGERADFGEKDAETDSGRGC